MAHKVGGLMSYWVLTINSTVIARTTVQRVTSLEMQQGHMKERTQAFDEAIRAKLKDSDHVILEGGKTQPHDWTDHPFEDDPDFTEEFHGVISDNEVKEADETFTPDVYDTYLNMELAIPQGDSLEPRLARVTKRLKDANGLPIWLAKRIPSWIQGCTKYNILTERKHHWRPTVPPKTCLHRLMAMGTVKYLWMRSLGTDPMNMLSNSKMHLSSLRRVPREGKKQQKDRSCS